MIRVAAPDPRRAEEIYDAFAKVFSGGGYFQALRSCREGYFAGSTYDWQVSRVAEDAGRVVAHIGVWRYRMRVGQARLTAGGIGAVMTHPDYRKRGLSRRLFREIFAAMRQAGYHFSMLFGIRDFYHRFGYVPAWANVVHVARTDALGDERLRLGLARVRDTDALCRPGPILRIYRRENAARTGSAERPIYTLAGGLIRDFVCRTLSDRAGRVRGYLVTRRREDELDVLEAGGLGPACGAGQLLAAARAVAVREKCRKVRLAGPAYDDPLCQALRRRECTVEMQHFRSGGPMAAVVSLRGCLDQMRGELARRLQASGMKGFAGAVEIVGRGERVWVEIWRGSVRLAPRPRKTPHRIRAGAAVARLVIGSADPEEMAVQSDVRYAGRGAELARAMFPRQWPMLSPLDRF